VQERLRFTRGLTLPVQWWAASANNPMKARGF